MKKIVYLLSLIVIIGGCTLVTTGPAVKKKAPPEKKAKTTNIKAKEVPEKYRISDLPVPDNYRFDEDKSFIFETETLRTGILVYNGGRKISEVIEFYKEEMPKYGWSLINIFQHKNATMLYEKEDWICEIRLEGSWSSNKLYLTIAPKDPGSAPPPNR